jgi:hypothetical protein
MKEIFLVTLYTKSIIVINFSIIRIIITNLYTRSRICVTTVGSYLKRELFNSTHIICYWASIATVRGVSRSWGRESLAG